MKRGPALFFGAIVAFGLGPAVWIGGTFATAEADVVPGGVPLPSPTVSISTVYIAVEPSDAPDFTEIADIADAWVPPSPSASPSPSLSPTPSPTPASPSPSASLSPSPSITPSASFSPPAERTPTPSLSPAPSADPSLAA